MAEISMRREIVKWFQKRSHWVVVRSSTTRLSGIVDRESGQVTILGSGQASGRPYTDYLLKSDRRKVIPDISIDTAVGDAALGVDHFYFEHYVPVKRGDLVLEIETASNGDPILPITVRNIYRILDPEDMRDGAGITSGRVEFFQCRVEQVDAS